MHLFASQIQVTRQCNYWPPISSAVELLTVGSTAAIKIGGRGGGGKQTSLSIPFSVFTATVSPDTFKKLFFCLALYTIPNSPDKWDRI